MERNYKPWLDENQKKSDAPNLTPQITEKYVLNHLRDEGKSVFYFVLDCLRLDQWLVMEKHLTDLFKIEKDY